MGQSVPKRRHIKFRHRGITRQKAYNLLSSLHHTIYIYNTLNIRSDKHNTVTYAHGLSNIITTPDDTKLKRAQNQPNGEAVPTVMYLVSMICWLSKWWQEGQ